MQCKHGASRDRPRKQKVTLGGDTGGEFLLFAYMPARVRVCCVFWCVNDSVFGFRNEHHQPPAVILFEQFRGKSERCHVAGFWGSSRLPLARPCARPSSNWHANWPLAARAHQLAKRLKRHAKRKPEAWHLGPKISAFCLY